jgi:urocanate hydratase
MLHFDVNNGIARRAWARNTGALSAIQREQDRSPNLTVTIPYQASKTLIDKLV